MFCFNGKCYLQQPPRAWSRVQNSCSLIAPTNDTDNAFVRVPYTDQIVPYVELGPRLAMINKGNVLVEKQKKVFDLFSAMRILEELEYADSISDDGYPKVCHYSPYF